MREWFLCFARRISRNRHNGNDRELRAQLSEKKVDKMVADSFPASDPPSTY